VSYHLRIVRCVYARQRSRTGNPDVMNMEGKVRTIALMIVGISVACGGSGLTTTQPSPINAMDAGRSLVVVEKGRNKIGPAGTCVFDPNDSGPDQCTLLGTSQSSGRFKAGPGNTCVFDPTDSGPNQCTP
jgi:hypothetical protein